MDSRRDPESRILRPRLALARLALAWERAWPEIWPIPSLIAAFAGLALANLLPHLPGWLHLIVLAAFAAALLWHLPRLGRLRWPDAAAGRRRLEQASGLRHGPLQALADGLATGRDDPVARALWDAHRRRLRQALARLGLPLPGPVMARQDPLGLRFAALFLLAVGLAAGWRAAPERFDRAFDPDMEWLLGPPPALQVWVTPPDYTHQAPILLEKQPPGAPVRVPTGSRVLAELQGGRGAAHLMIGGRRLDFERLDADSQRVEATIAGSGELTVRQLLRRVDGWQVQALDDHPPRIDFAKTPDADPRGRIRFEIAASADYGLASGWIEMRRAEGPAQAPVAIELPIAGHPRELHQSSWHDLTAHPWAGFKVTLTPFAKDDAGKIGAGQPVTVTLPEREFNNPVARALVEIRRELVADPSQRDIASESLEGLAAQPRMWGGDMIVALALGEMRARLDYDHSKQAVPSVIDTLWQTALRLEEGDRPAAERALDEAAQALEKALAENAPEAEIERRTAELRAAIDRMLRSMVEQALKSGQRPMEPLPGQQAMSPQDLDRMLSEMREQSRAGARDAARQTLDQLRAMLDQLRAGRPVLQSREQQDQARHTMESLGGIARDQQGLLDQTFRRQQRSKGGVEPSDEAAQAQESLRRRLGDAMEQLGDLGSDIPEALGQAEQAMREATDALGKGEIDAAVDAQTRALDGLRRGSKDAGAALAQRMGGNGLLRMPGQGRNDPLGRPLTNGGNADDEPVKIPTQADLQKAREVLDELRRRSGEAQRPAEEHKYLERLLERLF